MERIQSAIADALWQDRPHWRHKAILIGIVHKAYRLDPFLCRAFATIVETIKFLQTSDVVRQCWEDMYKQDNSAPQSLMAQLSQACQILSIDWRDAFQFTIFQAEPICFLSIGTNDLRCLLKSVVAHCCYLSAGKFAAKRVFGLI